MNNLTLVIASLGCGGAERVMSILANEWASRGKTITLITLSGSASDFYKLDERVRRIALNVQGNSHGVREALRNNLKRIALVRRAIQHSAGDAVITFGDATNILVLAATLRLKVPVVVSERVDPSRVSIGRGRNALRALLYRRASAIVMQAEVLRVWALRFTSPARVFIIPNPVQSEADYKAPTRSENLILAAGRLVPQKGFDLLLKAFASIAHSFPDWRLAIYGEGPSRGELQELAAQLHISDRVSMPGVTASLSAAFSDAAIFAFPSRFEGFPNALIEAMAHGLPVVAADCPTGPQEIITPEVNGLLIPVDDSPALAEALRRMILNPELRRSLGGNAREVCKTYSLPGVLKLWDELLAKI